MTFFNLIPFNGYGQIAEQSTESELPIMAYHGVPEDETSVQRFKEMENAGFHISFTHYSNIYEVEKALDSALLTGIRLLVHFPELFEKPELVLPLIKDHPALFGYHIKDEPSSSDFLFLSESVNKIQAIDNNHPCYINLFPNKKGKEARLFDQNVENLLGGDPYSQYVNLFLDKVPVPILSFDFYPIAKRTDGYGIHPDWYNNLELLSKISQERDLPLWAFSLSLSFRKHFKITSTAEIKLQMYSNLAYGAQGLQYFTYWRNAGNILEDFHNAPIDLDGRRTIVYDRVKHVNKEIQKYANVFLGARVEEIYHTGTNIPSGTRRIEKLPDKIRLLETSEKGAIVSILKNKDRKYLVIVNKDFEDYMKLTLVADESVQRVLSSDNIVPVSLYKNTLEIDPGDVMIFSWLKD